MRNIAIAICAAICAAICVVFTGCKTLPTPAQIETASYAIGASAALACNMTKISDADRQIVIDIMNDIKYYTPTAGESIAVVWTSIAQQHVSKLVEDKKVNEAESALIISAFGTVSSAADYMVRIRWPEISAYADLVVAATHGFCDGFLTSFKPATSATGFSAPRMQYDEDAYNYLIKLPRN